MLLALLSVYISYTIIEISFLKVNEPEHVSLFREYYQNLP